MGHFGETAVTFFEVLPLTQVIVDFLGAAIGFATAVGDADGEGVGVGEGFAFAFSIAS